MKLRWKCDCTEDRAPVAMAMDRLTEVARRGSLWVILFADDTVICRRAERRWRKTQRGEGLLWKGQEWRSPAGRQSLWVWTRETARMEKGEEFKNLRSTIQNKRGEDPSRWRCEMWPKERCRRLLRAVRRQQRWNVEVLLWNVPLLNSFAGSWLLSSCQKC